MIPLRDLNPSRTTPWVTWGFILLCAVAFLYTIIQPEWMQRAIMADYALVPVRLTAMLRDGPDGYTLLTLVTSMFMHGGWLHVLGNLWFLRIFGDNVEDNLGHGRFVVFYLLCGLAAAGAQWAVNPFSSTPMVGASGAIAGVLAAYLVLYPRARVLTLVPIFVFIQIVELPAFWVIAIWFGLQFFSGLMSLGMESGGGVAYWAHIGGFAAGLLLALIMRRRPPPEPEYVYAQRDEWGPPPRRGW